MQVERAHQFTVYRVILGDMLLNWFLAVVLLIFPQGVDRLIGEAEVLPPIIYRIFGICFVLFAAWQTWIVRQGTIGPPGLVVASLLALIPVLMLSAALLFTDAPLRPVWRIILWIGNIYMLLLGVWYLTLARVLARTA